MTSIAGCGDRWRLDSAGAAEQKAGTCSRDFLLFLGVWLRLHQITPFQCMFMTFIADLGSLRAGIANDPAHLAAGVDTLALIAGMPSAPWRSPGLARRELRFARCR